MYRVQKEAWFAASHHLRNYHGKCENMHGHNWRVLVIVEGRKLDAGGMLIDFGILKREILDVLSALDHKNLNEIEPFDRIEPSAENLARYVCDNMARRIDTERIRVAQVDVWETHTSRAMYIPDTDE